MANEGPPASGAEARIQLCGRFAVRISGERVEGRMPGRQGRLLFAYLAARPSRAATRDELAEALWPGKLPSAPEMAISALVSKLRRLLGEETIAGRREIALQLPTTAFIDAEHARNAIHRAKSLIAAERWWDAYAPAATARYISEREFMRGEAAPWIDGVRRELEDIHLAAVECDATIGLAVGGAEESGVARSARRLIELAPYRESGYRLLMQALEREGNCAEALIVYERLRRVLMDELGSAPSAKTQELHSRLLAGT